jgi:hypothetical protein
MQEQTSGRVAIKLAVWGVMNVQREIRRGVGFRYKKVGFFETK